MVAMLVVLTFVVMVALDYYVFSRRHPELSEQRVPVRAPALLAAVNGALPPDTFVHPTFTWCRAGPAGSMYLGLHPILLGLVGPGPEVEFLAEGEHIAKGEALARIGRGGRHLTVRSPVTGRIEQVNRPSPAANGREAGPWVYRLVPERARRDAAEWLTGDEAVAWSRRRYDELRAFMLGAVADRHLGVTMADGGELPVGVLSDMDEQVWSGVQVLIEPRGDQP